MSQDYTHQKSFKSLGLCPPNRYEIDLSNEVLNIDFGQGAAKIPEVQVGIQKKYLRTHVPGVSRVVIDDFFTIKTPPGCKWIFGVQLENP